MNDQFLSSLISAIVVGGVAGYLGSLMIQKKMALIAGPLGHLAFPGVALALLYGFDISLGAFPFIILGILFIWILEIKTKLPTETLTAIVFAFGVSVALIFLPLEEAESALAGNIANIGWQNTIITLLLSLIVFIITKTIYNKIILTTNI